ncbi:Protein kintoun [Thoreauomyces humboldtii]|nr:Protein kintoun [Thoreauomyces humboldtii]
MVSEAVREFSRCAYLLPLKVLVRSIPALGLKMDTSHLSSDETAKLNITTDEFQKIEESLKDKEFRSLFMDYMQEISDPENRKIYEAELAQMEAERGNAVRFVTPTPGHVIKTHVKTKKGSMETGKKVFINMSTSPEILVATPEASKETSDGPKGTTWSIPYSLTKPREDLDAAGSPCTVYDCVFHPDTYKKRLVSAAFEKLFATTAMEGIEREFKVTLEKKYRTPRMSFKGTPVASVIRITTPGAASNPSTKLSKASFLASLSRPSSSSHPPSPPPPTPVVSTAVGLPSLLPLPNTAPLIENISPAAGPVGIREVESAQDVVVEPKYTITHRGQRTDYQEYTQERERQKGARPDELVVRIELPGVRSSSTVDLTPRPNHLTLTVPSKYSLSLPLPFTVLAERAQAVFEKRNERLIVTMPVVKAPDAVLPASSAKFEVPEQEEKEVTVSECDGLNEEGDGWVRVESPNKEPPPSFPNEEDVEVVDSDGKPTDEEAAGAWGAISVSLSNTLMYDLED